MAVLVDAQMRFYLVVSQDEDVVTIIERGDDGPDVIRRRRGEESMVGVRHITLHNETERVVFAKLFSTAATVTGAHFARNLIKWIEGGYWSATPEALYTLRRVVYIEDSIEWLQQEAREKAKHKGEVLDRARLLRYGTRGPWRFSSDKRPKQFYFSRSAR